jgi:phosphoserine aminotransferase
MGNERIYNFSAGPSMLPESALQRAAAEMLNYGGSGMSVMEMSHRSKVYQGIFDEAKAKLKALLQVPDTHEILFLQGGASLQFSMIPLNLMGESGTADYAVTGNFANTAAKEAAKYGTMNLAATSADRNHTYIPQQSELKLSPDASYFYYCANNTIFGTEWNYIPETASPLVCDMSSNILSRRVDVSRYGIIFAGAQKNMAPAGLTVVIINKSLAGHEPPYTPLMMSYQRMIDKDSMFNTPPCYNIYILGLVLDWINEQGGLAAMEKLRAKRSGMLYDFLDESSLFYGCADKDARSGMNVTFRSRDPELEADFVKTAAEAGFVNLKGHRSVGGMRASIYNAMPVEGVEKLVAFMKEYEVKHRV